MPVKVTFPEPDNLGIYRFGDGSTITPERDTSRWNAWWPDGSPMRDEDGGLLRFDSPGTAAYALVRGGAAMDSLPPPPPSGNQFSRTLKVVDGEDVMVYLGRFDPSSEQHLAELSFVTASLSFSITGVAAEELKALARLIRDYVRTEMTTDDD